MTKLFISQPMRGRCVEDILFERHGLVYLAQEMLDCEVQVLDSYFADAAPGQKPLVFLGKALEQLATADAAIFAPGWEDARGCRIEHMCCEEYGVVIIEPCGPDVEEPDEAEELWP